MTVLRASSRPGALLAGLSLVLLAACGGGGTSVDHSTVVTRVDVTSASDRVEVGSTVQLSAVARNRDGGAVPGKTFTWSSSDDAVALVGPSGLVTARAAGAVTITATADDVAGTRTLTVDPIAVGRVTVSPANVSLSIGKTQQMSATPQDVGGNLLTGRTVTWQSTAPGVATVSAAGLVTAVANGQAQVVATVEGKADTADVTVAPPPAVRVAVTPAFGTTNVSQGFAFTAAAFQADGAQIASPAVAWAITSGGSVGSDGVASAPAKGLYRVAATVDQAADTAALAVLGPASLLSTAFAGGAARTDAAPGQTFTVPIVLDLSRVSPSGDLGSAQLELRYDPAVFSYVSHTVGVSGFADVNTATAGKVAFAMAATAAHGSPEVTLLTVTLRVADGTAAGTRRRLTLLHTAAPTSTGFAAYEVPVSVGGTVRVVAPAQTLNPAARGVGR